MTKAPGHSKLLTVAIGLLLPAGGCMTSSGGHEAGTGGQASGGAGGGSSGGSGGQGRGGAGGAGGAGDQGGSSGSGGVGSEGTGGAGGSGNGGARGTGGRQGGNGGRGSSAGGSSAGGSSAGGSSAGGTGGRTGTDPNGGPGAITGLTVQDNPKNVLSAFVTWTTEKPADSVVQFGQGKYEWEISDEQPVTSHKVLIIGMYAGKSYQIKAMSTAGGQTSEATGAYTTKALPAQIPVATIGANDTTKVQPGWTLMNIIKSNSTTGPIGNSPSAAAMYDATGQPVWYHINGTTNDFGGAVSTYLTDKGVLIGPVMGQNGAAESPREVDFAGKTIWECKEPLCGGTGDLTHDTIKLSNGNHVVLRWKALGSGGMNMDSAPVFEELDASGAVVWSLDYAKLVPKPASASGDWCHGNAIVIDIAKDVVYANCRFMGIVKTSYKNPGSLIWHMAAQQGGGAGTITFSPSASQFIDIHDPEIHEDGTVLVFDNGGYAMSMGGPSTTTRHSRAVEYKLDESAKSATAVWEFPGTFTVDTWYKNNWYTSYFGDADRLANGNVLIAAGSVGANVGDARVFEVLKADGKVVWEFKLPSTFGVYRADRIVPPLVKPIVQ